MDWLEAWFSFRDAHSVESSAIVWFVHATLVILIAWLIAEVVVRRFAVVRYSVWIITCFSLLTLAIVSVSASPLAISLHLLPEPPPDPTSHRLSGRGSERSDARTWPAPSIVTDAPDTGGFPAFIEPKSTSNVIDRPEMAASSLVFDDAPAMEQGFPWHLLLASIYALGVLFFSIRTVVGFVQLSRLVKRSSPISESRLELVRRCAREIGLSSCPVCLQSDEVRMPMAIGVLHPTVLLPADLVKCDLTIQRHCMLHELSHLQHRDCLWNLLGEITKAVYWFHPGVYLVREKLTQSREYVADDHTIQCCESPASYSRTMLALNEIVGDAPKIRAGIGAAAHIERRIRRVLDPNFRCQSLPRWVMLIPAILLVALSTCMIQLERAVAQQPVQTDESIDTPGDQTTTRPPSASNTPAATAVPETVNRQEISLYEKFERVALDEVDLGSQYPVTIAGQVVDDRAPVPDAIVLLRLEARGTETGDKVPIVARARTDREGHYRAKFRHTVLSSSSKWYRVEVLAADKQGRLAMDVRQFTNSSSREIAIRVNLVMNSDRPMGGTIQSTNGQALGGVRVGVLKASVTRQPTSDDDPFASDPFAGSDPFGRSNRSSRMPLKFRFPEDRIRPTYTTKEDGKFEFMRAVSLSLSVEKEGMYRRMPELHAETPRASPHRDFHRSPAAIRLAPKINVATEITDQAGNRIRDFEIRIRNTYWRLRQKNDGTIATAESYLRESADEEGQTLVYVTFPKSSGLLPVLKSIDVQELLSSRLLKVEAESGIWMSGRVVTRDTGKGLASVGVRWRDPLAMDARTLHYAPTDGEGYWKLLAPRRRGFIEAAGIVPGYDLEGGTPVEIAARELIEAVNPGDAAEVSLPDFEVRPIPPVTVVVVDASGRPVRDADVSAVHSVTFRDIDGRSFTNPDATLAMRTESDDDGTCELLLTRSTWENGLIKVSRTFWPDDAKSNRDMLIQSGQAEIDPKSAQPIKVVVKDHVHLRGRALVDGKPLPALRVGLATRSEKAGPFDKYYDGYVQTTDGAFEFQVEPTGEYAIMLCLLEDESNGERHYYHQAAIPRIDAKTREAGTINIRLDQFKEISSD